MAGWTCLTLEVEAAAPGVLEGAEAVYRLADGIEQVLEVSLPGRSGHLFEPQGVSHIRHGPAGWLAIHTWPEWAAATVDLWMEGDRLPRLQSALRAWLEEGGRFRVAAARLYDRPMAAPLRPPGSGS